MQDKKGFTLVELLAVIVILAVVMVIAVTAVTPLMAQSQKGALGSEGLSLVDAAQIAYQSQQMATGDKKIKPTQDACFDLHWLEQNGYYTSKKSLKDYTGSALVTYNSADKTYSYKFWISDGSYVFENQDVTGYSYENAKDGGNASNECGGGLAATTKIFKASSTPVGGNTEA